MNHTVQYCRGDPIRVKRPEGIPNATDYYLVTTSNPDGNYVESNLTNNSAWVKFTLSADSNGNRKVTVTGHSPCDSPGMCGEVSANR